MTRVTLLVSAALITGVAAGALLARQAQGLQPFFEGNRLGLPVNPGSDGAFEPTSPNVKVYGSIYSAESCSYDAGRGLIVVANRGVPQMCKRTTPGCRSSTTTDPSTPHAG